MTARKPGPRKRPAPEVVAAHTAKLEEVGQRYEKYTTLRDAALSDRNDRTIEAYDAGMTQPEIAKLLGLSTASVQNICKQADSIRRALMEKDQKDD